MIPGGYSYRDRALLSLVPDDEYQQFPGDQYAAPNDYVGQQYAKPSQQQAAEANPRPPQEKIDDQGKPTPDQPYSGPTPDAVDATVDPSPSKTMNDDPWSALLGTYQQQTTKPLDIPPPPMKGESDNGPAMLGLGLDILLNRGRHVPQMLADIGKPEDIPYENWRRQLEWEKARNPGYGRGGRGYPGGELGAALAIERLKTTRERNDIQGRGLTLREAANARAEKLMGAAVDPNDASIVAVKGELAKRGMAPEEIDAMSPKDLRAMLPYIEKDLGTRPGSPLEQQAVVHAGREAAAKREPIPQAAARAAATGQAGKEGGSKGERSAHAGAMVPPPRTTGSKAKTAKELRDEGWR